ncbi:MAG: hypothetical protein JXA67_22365, partial [Micromonosporaceae bacterium]|nr:hypothetical protein [Micromonosporaceae bacterium]
SDILVSGWGRSPKDAEAFLRRSLATDRLVVLLDGLDEVPADRQEAVLEAVYRFTQDRNPQLPTARARVIVTCRRQNFVALRERWINVIKDGVYTLAPLRDSEIYAYLQKLSTRFRDPEHGPEAFLHAVRASGSLDLHRTPLVLAMSVGLYAQKTTFEIPSEIAELYGQMITEMLERQAFKKDPGTSLLRYTVADKVRLLREFAAGNAQGREGFGERFGEFSLAMLSRHAKDLASRLDAVDDPVAFVREIVDRSGLIAPVGDGMCVFAHRSIQEYLVAEELRQFAPNGAQILLDHAADPAWRQVVLFYTGTDRQSQSAVDDFLLRLAEDDLPLAGHCLAGAKATNPVARTILHRIADEVRAQHAVCLHLSAMLGATRSPRMAVRELAVFLVRDVLSEIIGQPDVFEVLGGDLDGVARVIQALAETDAAHVAELVPKIVSAVPDDPSLVAPLWLCLAVPGLADQPGAARIVERLLTLVMAPEGLAELETQQPISSAFATAELRRAVYPFRKGHPLHSNLVTLLCWAQHLRAIPMPPNRFFEASLADRSAFARVEEDRNRTQLAMLHWPARIVSATGAAAALLAAVAVCLRWNDLARPPGWLTLWWMLLPLVAVPVAFFTATAWAERRPEQSLASQYLRGGSAPGSGRSGNLVAEALARVVPGSGAQLLFLVTTVVYAVATLPLNAVSPAGYALTAAAANAVFGWLPFIRVFDRGVRYYLYRPNPFSDMYDDGRSRPWLDPDASHSSSRPVLAENRPE